MKSDLSFGLLNKAQNLHAVILCRKNLARNQKPRPLSYLCCFFLWATEMFRPDPLCGCRGRCKNAPPLLSLFLLPILRLQVLSGGPSSWELPVLAAYSSAKMDLFFTTWLLWLRLRLITNIIPQHFFQSCSLSSQMVFWFFWFCRAICCLCLLMSNHSVQRLNNPARDGIFFLSNYPTAATNSWLQFLSVPPNIFLIKFHNLAVPSVARTMEIRA